MVRIDREENLIRLMNQYGNLVFSICLKTTGDYFASEDLAQETFIAAYKAYDSFDGTNEKAWICRIAGNKSIDYLRSAERRSVPTSDEEMPPLTDEHDPQHLYGAKSIMEDVERECMRLPEGYRDVSVRFFVQGQTAREIATETDCKLKTVQTKIHRAKEMLKKSIGKEMLLE